MIPLHEGDKLVFTSLIHQLANLTGADEHVSCEPEKCAPELPELPSDVISSKPISEDWREVNFQWC